MAIEDENEVYYQYCNIPSLEDMEIALYKVAWKLRELSNAIMESLDCEGNSVYLVLRDTCQTIDKDTENIYRLYNIARHYEEREE